MPSWRSSRRHLTEFGPATERVDSPAYAADGYWRGPIWAPSTFIIEQGLRAAGRDALADDVAARFLRLCEVGGFAENFDALTGEGLPGPRLHMDGGGVPAVRLRLRPRPSGRKGPRSLPHGSSRGMWTSTRSPAP